MATLTTIVVFIVAFAASCPITGFLAHHLRKKGIMDIPNERSSHEIPTPRGGGIAVVVGLGVAAVTTYALGLEPPLPLLGGTLIIAAVGWWDDHSGHVSPALRLIIQAFAAYLFLHEIGGPERLPLPAPLDIELGLLSLPLGLFWLVAVTNLFNFLDGIDGHAALEAALYGLFTAALFSASGVGAMAAGLAGAALGFLVFNYHPAKIFMGDVGSAPLGFFTAGLWMSVPDLPQHQGIFWSALFLWFFLADGTFTILRRLSRGEKIWKPHRTHLYQRLASLGLPHDKVSNGIGALSLIVNLCAYFTYQSQGPTPRWWLLAVAGLLFALLAVFVFVRQSRVVTEPSIPSASSTHAAQKIKETP